MARCNRPLLLQGEFRIILQVLVRDEEDDCFGLWMMYDGKLIEVPLPRTVRTPYESSVTGVLMRTDQAL